MILPFSAISPSSLASNLRCSEKMSPIVGNELFQVFGPWCQSPTFSVRMSSLCFEETRAGTLRLFLEVAIDTY